MDRIAEYRRRAAEARKLASKTRHLDLEESLEKIAATWELLALEAEQLAALYKAVFPLATSGPDRIQSESPGGGSWFAADRAQE